MSSRQVTAHVIIISHRKWAGHNCIAILCEGYFVREAFPQFVHQLYYLYFYTCMQCITNSYMYLLSTVKIDLMSCKIKRFVIFGIMPQMQGTSIIWRLVIMLSQKILFLVGIVATVKGEITTCVGYSI